MKQKRGNKMAKTIPASGAGAIRIMLKNKDAIQCDLREKQEDGTMIMYRYDIFYENVTGNLSIRTDNGEIVTASLQLSFGKILTLDNDGNMKKFCNYILELK